MASILSRHTHDAAGLERVNVCRLAIRILNGHRETAAFLQYPVPIQKSDFQRKPLGGSRPPSAVAVAEAAATVSAQV
jgi:hypothetical protein